MTDISVAMLLVILFGNFMYSIVDCTFHASYQNIASLNQHSRLNILQPINFISHILMSNIRM
jgi:hypothetical protein